ncbi:MAG: hypothetical protein HC869_19560 [Rhodospirillales bacterium]|nr:hypothetical protein [Rhodospirillales bacterium]
MNRTIDALQTARTFLSGDRVFGYSNLLGALSALVSHEYLKIDRDSYPQILDILAGDEEPDFRLRQKINAAQLAHYDRSVDTEEIQELVS